MMNKKTILISFLAIALLLIAPMTAEALTYARLISPATNGTTQCGTSVSITTFTDGVGESNISVCYNTSSGGTLTNIGTNTSAGTNNTATWDTSAVSDGTYGLVAFVNYTSNSCSGLYNTTIGYMLVDNTAPVITYTSATPADKSKVGYGKTFAVTTDESDTSCTLYLNNSGNSQSYSLSGATTSWSYTFGAGSPPEKEYTWYISCQDTTSCLNEGTATVRTVTIKDTSGAAAKAGAVALAISEGKTQEVGAVSSGIKQAISNFVQVIKNIIARMLGR